MTREEKLEMHRLASLIDSRKEEEKARQEHLRKFEEGIKKIDCYIPEDMTPIAAAKRFIADRINELDSGDVGCFDFVAWDVVAFICGFNMTYTFTGTVECGFDEVTGLPLSTIAGLSGCLDEMDDQQLLLKSLQTYFTAGAALAKRIGASNYQDWINMMIEFAYDRRRKHPDLEDRIRRLNRQTWAENEAYKRNQMITQTHPTKV